MQTLWMQYGNQINYENGILPTKQMEIELDIDSTPPTRTEVLLTTGVIGLVINMRGLLKEYEELAAKHDIIPDPNICEAIEAAINHAHIGIATKLALIETAEKFGTHMLECTNRHVKKNNSSEKKE